MIISTLDLPDNIGTPQKGTPNVWKPPFDAKISLESMAVEFSGLQILTATSTADHSPVQNILVYHSMVYNMAEII